METTPQKTNINIDPSVKALFADDVVVACVVKQEKEEKGKANKEGYVSLIFTDKLCNTAVARITLIKSTAKALAKILKTNVDELEKELAKKGETKRPGPSGSTSEDRNDYIG